MVDIAKFRRALFYFWVFGSFSVLLDLDHVIPLYRDGLELSIENLAYHGTRSLHIPLLIFTGCICIVTGALFLRFLYLTSPSGKRTATSKLLTSRSGPIPKSSTRRSVIINLTANSVLAPFRNYRNKKLVIVECPQCNNHMAIKPANPHQQLACTYCGVEGYMKIN